MSTKRNTSGDKVQFNYWTDYTDKKDMFAMTSSITRQQSRQEIKHNPAILPMDNEELKTWLQRTIKESIDLTEYSRYHHITGTTKTWACHTSSRYCFICVLCDFVDILRIMADGIQKNPQKFRWSITLAEDESNRYQLQPI